MASQIFCILFVLSAAFIGLYSCAPNECSFESMERCKSIKWPNGCPDFPKMVVCLKKLGNCSDDILEERKAFIIKWYTEETNISTICPGLPEGKCLSSEMNLCTKDIPMDIEAEDNLIWKPVCMAHNGKTAGIKKCLAGVERNCQPKKDFIHGEINWLNNLEVLCKERHGIDINPEGPNTDDV